MLNSEIEFKDKDDFIEVWYEDDMAPFNDIPMGVLEKDGEGYYRFHPNGDAVMTCKHFRIVGAKISELNFKP